MANMKIPAHRMAECKLRVVDKDTQPLANKKVHAKLTNHQFLFGCGAFDTIPFVKLPEGDEKKKVKDRVEKWLRLFNYGTLPFYWGMFEHVEGETETDSRLKAAKFLRSQGVTVKGHPLCWHTACADWLMKYDNETILKKQIERINREVSNFKGIVDMWDVINEVVIMPNFDKYDNAITRICKEKGRISLVKEVFAAAKEQNPNATLLLNDFNTSAAYEILIDGCLEAGVPIDVIGIQSHQHQGYWGAEKLQDILNRFGRFGLPIHFTENTLISGDIMPAYIEDLNDFKVDEWPSTEEGEARQAKEVEEMYSILFDNPLVQGITTWDFSDGAWLGAPSGVIHKDGTVKPVYNKLMELIHENWSTDVDLITDDNGQIVLNGVKGEYTLTCEGRTFTCNLTDHCHEKEIRLS